MRFNAEILSSSVCISFQHQAFVYDTRKPFTKTISLPAQMSVLGFSLLLYRDGPITWRFRTNGLSVVFRIYGPYNANLCVASYIYGWINVKRILNWANDLRGISGAERYLIDTTAKQICFWCFSLLVWRAHFECGK